MKKRKQKTEKAKKMPQPKDAALAQREVDNPYFSTDHPESQSNPKRINVAANTKESAVETLYARKFLSSVQKKAADKIGSLWQSCGGSISSIDYTLDRVSGGRGDPVSGQLLAAHELRRCRELLGRRGFDLVIAVCGEGLALSELSPHKRNRLTMADNLRADLDDLATMWGMRTKPRRL